MERDDTMEKVRGYRRYSNTAELIELETAARKKKLGLWHAGDAAPPWEFRKKRKK